MKCKKVFTTLLLAGMAASVVVGCGQKKETSGAVVDENGVKEFTTFFAVPGTEINADNDVQEKIADITGAKAKEVWLTGQTAQEAIGTMIAGGEYPDFIDGGPSMKQLYEAGAMVPLDDYLDQYPNLKAFLTDSEWEKLRQDDGHIYWIPQFGSIYGEDNSTTVDEAFWLQTRVLKWAGYPKVTTMDEYFDLIEKYNEAHPTLEDGTANIPYTILYNGTRTWSLDNAPNFLDGYPNDGCVEVDPEKKQVIDYNTSSTAKIYFNKLNEEFKKGIVDPESFTQTYDEYIAKVSTGRVLGLIDQWWCFQKTRDSIVQQGLDKQGCNYVPLPVTLNSSIKNQWFTAGRTLNVSEGLAITTSCKDVKGALQFLDDLLSQEVLTLRLWGIKDVDYKVGEDGVFYRTDEMREKAQNPSYKASHMCIYSYFPFYKKGTLADGINATSPESQPNEFFQSLPEDVQECFTAYGCKTYVDMLGRNPLPGPWYPLWTYGNSMTSDSPGGKANLKLTDIKKEYMPKVVMSKDFEQGWDEYMKAYNDCNPQAYIDEIQKELERRIEVDQNVSKK